MTDDENTEGQAPAETETPAQEAQAEGAPAAEAAPAEKKEKVKKRGIGDCANEAIMAGKTNEEALAAVKAEFPDANTTMSSINWYRNKLRQDGRDVASARDLKAGDREKAKAEKAAKKEAEKAEKAAQRAKEKAAKEAAKTSTTSADAIAKGEAQAEPAQEENFLA